MWYGDYRMQLLPAYVELRMRECYRMADKRTGQLCHSRHRYLCTHHRELPHFWGEDLPTTSLRSNLLSRSL